MTESQPGNVLITGASGMIGRALSKHLTSAGFQVYSLHRDTTDAPFFYESASNRVTLANDIPLQAVINLAGPSLADKRWTPARKEYLKSSRVNLTRALAEAIATAPTPPDLLLSASAIGYYGLTGANTVNEHSPPGNDFLADIARDWESATRPAELAGVNTVHMRFGVVLSNQGGMLQQLLLPFRLGLGGRIGSGEQFISWISLPDVLTVIHTLLLAPPQSGPINLVAEQPVTNAAFARELGRALHRPALLPLPAPVAKLMFGEMAELLLLGSSRVQSTRLPALGIALQHPTLPVALAAILRQ